LKELKNKNCFLTGAASGIGRSFARALAKEGMNLYISDINMARLEKVKREIGEMGAKVIAVKCDVSKYEDFQKAADDFHSQLGDMDLLINNAGIAISGGIEELELEDWREVLDINLWSIIHSLKVFLPKMLEKKSGHIVNVASTAGVCGTSEPLPYITSKFAVVGLSEALYGQLYSRGIRISVIVPSYIKTNIFTESKMKFSKKLIEDHGRDKLEEVFMALVEDMKSKSTSPDRAVKKYIAQIKEDVLYISEAGSAMAILASKAQPRMYEDFLVRLNENFAQTRKEKFLKFGINLDDYS
jgi:3-oxoacyl-[acyl-carrier protein] reductase